MNYGAVQYSLKDRAYDIFLSGCAAPHCEGCHNPDLWDFNAGKDLDPFALIDSIHSQAYVMIDKIRIMGGEPFDQHLGQLKGLIDIIITLCPEKDVWIFTKYKYEELTSEQQEVLQYVDYAKHGRFKKDRPPTVCPFTNLELASDNQYVQHYLSRNLIHPSPQSNPRSTPAS